MDRQFWMQARLPDASAETLAEARGHLGLIEAPRETLWLASVINIVALDYGYLDSVRRNSAVWGDGEPIPMYTYALIEYLRSLDFSGVDVAEFGAGASTRFWAARARSVAALENDPAWIETLRSGAAANVELIHAADMPAAFLALQRSFGVIVVDCKGNRFDCAAAAIDRLAPGGMIILDNSDWYPNTARLLRDADLIQVDFPGLRPGRFHACATSIFLRRDFVVKPRGATLPAPPAGGKPRPSGPWDQPSSLSR